MMNNLSKSILNSDDLSTVKTGAPAYLLMIDSLIHKDPNNKNLLRTAAMLYTAYADLFVKDITRSKKMSDKALNYAKRAVCLENNDACAIKSKTFKEFENIISNMKTENVPALFTLGNAWAGWIMVNKNDFNAIADMPRIELIMQRVTELDKTYRDGAAYLYLGTLASLLPPALGGRPEQAKLFFNKAIQISQGKNLMVKVIYAKMHARMMFDRKLHDKLLNEVLSSDPYVPGYTLVNTWARMQALELLESADDYF
jgi:tetratricopeptide (TPR) repeat protein